MSMVDEIAGRVNAIHPKLDWELGKGAVAEHGFTLSAVGNAELRATAARWLALAPPPDDTWEFHDGRQPNPTFDGTGLRIEGHDLSLGETRFHASAREHAVDIAVFHPAFADLPDSTRTRVAFLCLDWALGEHAVETWVGQVDVATVSAPQTYTVEELRNLVADLARRHEESPWTMLQGQTRDGRFMLATTQVPLRGARWPRFDTHVALTLPFDDRGNGMPTEPALESLRAFEDSLTSLLGGDGELLAHETREGARTLHYYVDGETELPSRLAKAISGWRNGKCGTAADPTLKAIRHLDADR
jgi:hypothetical protein